MLIHQTENSLGNYNYNACIYKKALWESHFHRNYELIYGIKGITEILLNNNKYTLSEGEFILISPYTIHSITGLDNSEIWIGVFSEDHITAFAEEHPFVSFLNFRCDKKTENFLNEHLFSQKSPKKYMLMSCLYIICNECIKSAVRYNTVENSKFMYKVIEYISQNLNNDISLKTLSDKLHYEYHYFSSLFHECFCMNFKSFINIFRFETACKLLSDSAESVTSVCNKCGFGSIRNFNRVFKQLSGLSPSEYRKS